MHRSSPVDAFPLDIVPANLWRAEPRSLRRLEVTRFAEVLLGFPAARWLEPGFWQERLHPEDREEALEETRRALREEDRFVLEYRLLRADGRPVWVRDAAVVDRDGRGRPQTLIGAMVEMSDESAARLVATRRSQLATANRELDAFSYAVAHNLHAPLRKIDGFTRIVLEDFDRTLDPRAKDLLARVRGAAQSMSLLIDDLLALARVTRRALIVEELDLTAMAREVGDELARRRPGRSVRLEVQPGLKASGDPRLVRTALVHLLDNAWKFTAPVPEARVEVGRAAEPPHPFFVRDNGVGFDMAFADKLFQEFSRLHPPRQFPGSGVGLATVARVVRRHGGRVWAESAPGRGATFYFTLRPGPEDAP